jgi:hypothetical protein
MGEVVVNVAPDEQADSEIDVGARGSGDRGEKKLAIERVFSGG